MGTLLFMIKITMPPFTLDWWGIEQTIGVNQPGCFILHCDISSNTSFSLFCKNSTITSQTCCYNFFFLLFHKPNPIIFGLQMVLVINIMLVLLHPHNSSLIQRKVISNCSLAPKRSQDNTHLYSNISYAYFIWFCHVALIDFLSFPREHS